MLHLYISKLHKTIARKVNGFSTQKRLESLLRILKKSNFGTTDNTFKSQSKMGWDNIFGWPMLKN